MGGKGGGVDLGGIASNNPAIEREQGLLNAMKDYPGIELLDYQAADWGTQKANQIMSSFLTRFGDEIRGVHCANDTIGYCVLEALRAGQACRALSRSSPMAATRRLSNWS